MLEVFLRKTNGKGERIFLNPQLSTQQFIANVKQLFSEPRLSIFIRGIQLCEQSNISMKEHNITNGSIFHIKSCEQVKKETMSIKVYFQSCFHIIEVKQSNTKFEDICKSVLKQENKWCRYLLFHLGRKINIEESIECYHLNNGDLLTMIKLQNPSWNKVNNGLKGVKVEEGVESVTLATSEQQKNKNESTLETKRVMRKSSMKSSQESRDLNRNLTKQTIKMKESRSRSEGKNKNEESQNYTLDQNKEEQQIEGRKLFEGLNLFNTCWLSNKKIIQTESINCEEEDPNDPLFWIQCKVVLRNEDSTRIYVFECTQDHKFNQIDKILHKLERSQKLTYQCENTIMEKAMTQKLEDACLAIAQDLQMQELPHVIFS